MAGVAGGNRSGLTGLAAALLLAGLGAVSPPAQGQGATEQLRALVESTRSLRADFEQTVEDAQSKRIHRSTGSMVLMRPGRFRWDYLTPYPQLIVADGERIWIHDTELEQVTVKPLDAALGSAPSQLLSGGLDLDENFTYAPLPDSQGLAWIELEPRERDSNFERVRLGFRADLLAAMELEDGFGQITRFWFSAVERNARVDPGLFRFEPPPGVDVIGQ